MPKFSVQLKETAIYTIEVEADSADHAGEIAEEVFVNSPDFSQTQCEVLDRDVDSVEEIIETNLAETFA